jgi:hypothetical protein
MMPLGVKPFGALDVIRESTKFSFRPEAVTYSPGGRRMARRGAASHR